MPDITLIGKEHNAHLNWLLNTWIDGDSPVCFLEGFPGTGKTTIARELLAGTVTAGLTAVMITAPEVDWDPTDDLLLDLAMELSSAGRSELVNAIENNRPLLDVLSTIVNDPILIIIDDFQRSMRGTRAITSGGFAKVLSSLANRKWLKGRILLLTNRLVERARWSEPYAIRTLHGMSPDDGVELLEYFAREGGRLDEVALERRHDIVKLLGGNPRAIRLLVSNLVYESLDDLIGIQPELWEVRDREVSAEFVEDLERHLLEKALSQFSDDYRRNLYRLSVHRKPFKRQAIEQLFNDEAAYVQFSREMIDRFFMEQHKGWFSLHPIVREIGLQKLGQSPAELQQAHSIVAQYYTRHFKGERIVGWGALGGHFVEARYHLVKAGKLDGLKDITSRFQGYIFATLNECSPMPKSAQQLDERIAVLSALLETAGPKSLEYHLARLFQARNQRNDLRRGFHHARRAKSKSDFVPAWLLCGELLVQMQKPEEAISVLKQGVARIPPDKALANLYDSLAQLLAQLERYDEAISVLKDGMGRIPADKSLVELYDRCAQLLSQMGQHEEAIVILKQGMVEIPPDKALAVLYNRCAQLLSQMGRNEDAIAILKRGIERIPPHKGISPLYYSYGELLAQQRQYREAIAMLKQGIVNTPAVSSTLLYALCSELLFLVGQQDDAITLLKEGIDRVPPESGLNLIYSQYAKLLMASNQQTEAIETLLDGISKIPAHQPLAEILLLLYAAIRDEEGITRFMKTIEGIQPQCFALAQTLLYQVQGRWNDAAEYAEQMRKGELRYSTLAIVEAFSWLCVNQLGHARDAILASPQDEQQCYHWLLAFIQLRLGNIEEAKRALVAYDDRTRSLQNVDKAVLLALWDQPSTTLRQFDLAYYFPTLPPTLTGLPHSVTRITYQPSVLPAYFESEEFLSSQIVKEQEGKMEDTSTKMPAPISEKYIDFDLHIAPNGHAVASSIEGQASAEIPTEVPRNIPLSLKLIEKRAADADLLKEVGQALYDWLFPGSIHTHFQQTEAVARRDNTKMRLRLRIEAEEIASLPLEFLYRKIGGYYIAVNPDTVLSRYLNLAMPPGYVRRREGPLHMLAIIADPTDQTRLSPDEWESIIKNALAEPLDSGQMKLQTVKWATRKEIRNALLQQKPDIIQFVGHGIYEDGKGYLALVDEKTNGTWLVDDECFASLYRGHDDHLGLISLATCESAKSDNPQGFLGIAPQLVRCGVPAVLSMQYKVLIKTAQIFLEDFYTSVAARKPIDWATQAARNAVLQELGFDNREFAAPVLYMRAEDGEVF